MKYSPDRLLEESSEHVDTATWMGSWSLGGVSGLITFYILWRCRGSWFYDVADEKMKRIAASEFAAHPHGKVPPIAHWMSHPSLVFFEEYL